MERKSSKSILTLIFLIFFTSVQGQISKTFDPIDVFEIEYASDPQISPDGENVLYQRNFKDIMTDRNLSNIWMVNFDGSFNIPITTGNKNDFSPRWSHSGNKFTYKSNVDGKTQLYLYDVASKSIQKLTNMQSSIGNVIWSDDDKYLLFTSFVEKTDNKLISMPKKPKGAKWNQPPIEIDDMVYRYDGGGFRRPGSTQIFVLSSEGGTPRQVTELDKNINSPVWMNNEKILFSANLSENSDFEPSNSDIYLLDIPTGDIKKLTERFGPDYAPKVSPDKKHIAYLGYDDKFLGYQQNSLYIMDADGGNVKLVSDGFDRNISNINWKQDGKGLYFQYDTEGMTKIAYMSLNGKVKDIVDELGGLSLGRPYSGGSYTISDNGRYAFTYGNVYNPADLAVGFNGSKNRLTKLNDDLFKYKS